MRILAIDPGTIDSGIVVWNGRQVLEAKKISNQDVIEYIKFNAEIDFDEIVIEEIRSYGRTVGQEIFDTCVWCGRFDQLWHDISEKESYFIPRIEVKKHLCHRHIANDAEIRQVLIDRFGPKPTKKHPNLVYGKYKLKKDEWQALALAVTWYDKNVK